MLSKGSKYQNKVTKNLGRYLIFNSILYFIYSSRLLDLNINWLTDISIYIKDFINLNYSTDLFAFINFILISFASIKVIFGAKRVPIILILILLFIIRIDNNVVYLLGKYGTSIRMYLQEIKLESWMQDYFINSNYGIENLNYAISIFIPIYLYFKKTFYDKFIISLNRYMKKNSKNQNSTTKTRYKSNYSSGTTSNYYNNTKNKDYDNYYDNYDLYNQRNNYYGYNSYNEKEKFRVISEYDKEQAYNMRYTNPHDTIIDESGLERYVWEYANEYENEKRLEEERRYQEEQQSYHYYYDNDSYNYNPYENDNSWNNYDDYYNNNNDYYSDNNYGSNDSWF